jgi:hypothetical protein
MLLRCGSIAGMGERRFARLKNERARTPGRDLASPERGVERLTQNPRNIGENVPILFFD